MKLMFFPVTMIEEFPHVLLYLNFTRKKDRYFLSPYDVEVSSHGSQRTVCNIIHSSDFLCALLDIDRPAMLKQIAATNKNPPLTAGSMTTDSASPTPIDENLTRRAFSCSSSSTTPTTTPHTDPLLSLIEQRLDFKHRCLFYSTGPTSDLCVCALDVDYNSSVLCNTIGYPNLLVNDETNVDKSSSSYIDGEIPTKSSIKIRHQQRQYVHQWICIRDIIDGLITCNHILKGKSIHDILSKMNGWIKTRHESKTNVEGKSTRADVPLFDVTHPKLFKARARQLIWDLMEMKNEVRHPRPSHGRIPNFRYCEVAAENVIGLECFKRARVIKINPSVAQEPVRYFTLAYNKVLLTPTASLDSALFYKLDPKFLRRHQLENAATKNGAAELGTVIQLQALKQIHVDLIIIPSVVVNPITGARIGKGKGYADLEYAIMSQMGCVTNKTVVITTCHESQLINDIPNDVMEEHDLPVDIIVTPKRYIYTKRVFPRPTRIIWNQIDSDMMMNIPVLKELKRLEEQNLIKHS